MLYLSKKIFKKILTINSTNNYGNLPMKSSLLFLQLKKKKTAYFFFFYFRFSSWLVGWSLCDSLSQWWGWRGSGRSRERRKGFQSDGGEVKEMNQPLRAWCRTGCPTRRRQLLFLLQWFQHSFPVFPPPMPLSHVNETRQVTVINPFSHKATRDYFFF